MTRSIVTAAKRINVALPLLVLGGLCLLIFLPVLLFPHWGLFSDAEQILVSSPVFWQGDWSLKLGYLAGQLQRPVFHLMNYTLYKLVGEQPVYFYLNQCLMFWGTVILTYLNCLKLSKSVLASLVFASLWLISTTVPEVIYTLDKAELVSTLFLTASLYLYLSGEAWVFNPENPAQRTGLRWVTLGLGMLLANLLAFFAKQTPQILIFNCLSLPALALWFWGDWKQRPWLGLLQNRRLRFSGLYLATLLLAYGLYKIYYRFSGGDDTYLKVEFNLWRSLGNLYNYYRFIPDINTLVLFSSLSTIFWVGWRRWSHQDDQPWRAFQASSLTLLGFVTFLILGSWRSEVTYIWFPLNAFLLPAACYYALLWLSAVRSRWPGLRLRWLGLAGLASLLIIVPARAVEAQGIFNLDALKDDVVAALVQQRQQPGQARMTVALPFQVAEMAEIGERLEYFTQRKFVATYPGDQTAKIDRFRFFNFLNYQPDNPNYPPSAQFASYPVPDQTLLDPFTPLEPVGMRMFGFQDSQLWSAQPRLWTESRLTAGTYLLASYGSLPAGRFYFRGAGLFTEAAGDKFKFMPQVELEEVLTIERSLRSLLGSVGTMGWKLMRVKSAPPLSWNLFADGWLPAKAHLFYGKALQNSSLTLQGIAQLPQGSQVTVQCDGARPEALQVLQRSPQSTELTIPLNCQTPTADSQVFALQIERQGPAQQEDTNPDPRDLFFLVRSAVIKPGTP